MSGELQRGRAAGASRRLLRSDEPPVLTAELRARPGHRLTREPVGFPHRVILHSGDQCLPAAQQLRLMKAFSLAVARTQQASTSSQPVERLMLRVQASGAAAECAVSDDPAGELCASLPFDWLAEHDQGLQQLRRAVLGLVGEALDAPPRRLGSCPAAARPGAVPPGPAPKVLLFPNPFSLDVESSESAQVNPGIHALISHLQADGATLLLPEGKHPLQDVCMRHPPVTTPLAAADCYSDPEALVGLLAAHPDLDLVGLTVLERSFAQVRDLCRLIVQHSDAFIVVGGIVPTHLPEHCFAHLPDVDIFIRGDGEEVLTAVARAVAGRRRSGGFDEPVLAQLAEQQGILARAGPWTIAAGLDVPNHAHSLDAQPLDFSWFSEEQVESGLSLSTSRGCIYGCRFCSVMDRHLWRAQQPATVARVLADYAKRLREIYGSEAAIPAMARNLRIWDDDFFLDSGRARDIMRILVDQGFTSSFLQGTVASFFERAGRRLTEQLDQELIDAIPSELFGLQGGLKFGTESFTDPELKRLGKPYRYVHVRKLVAALAERGFRQDHYLILCNRQTSLDDLLDSLERIAVLRWQAGLGFNVLPPSWLMNLFTSSLYQQAMVLGRDQDQPHMGILHEPGYPELDYPFIIPERPERAEVFEVVRRFPSSMHFGVAGDPDWTYEGVFAPDDEDYLRIFGYLHKALVAVQQSLRDEDSPAARACLVRVDRALGRVGTPRILPPGVLRGVAPRLELTPVGEIPRLAAYVEALLKRGLRGAEGVLRYEVGQHAEGVTLRLTVKGIHTDFLIQRYAEGIPCAFHSRNLAFIARSSTADGAGRRVALKAFDVLQEIARTQDVHPL